MLDGSVQTTSTRIAAIVDELIGAGQPGAARDTDLRDRGLTSLGMVNVMLAIESEFGLTIPKRDLHPDNFRTIAAIEALVTKLTAGDVPRPADR
jgi:acyl carrier protein